MNLIIDQGNTVTKVAIFKGDTLVETFLYEVFNVNTCNYLLTTHDIQHCAFCTVIDSSEEVIYYLKKNIPYFLLIDETVALPLENKYKTPHTLGKDRLAAVVEANNLFPQNNVFVVDIGTAITYEFVNSKAEYKGGNISPGISMRFKALHAFTDKLPLVDRFGELPELGYDTETAIRSGVVYGVIFEIKSYIAKLSDQYSDLKVVLTGGHTRYVEAQLGIEVSVDVNLVLKGLNRILNNNVKN